MLLLKKKKINIQKNNTIKSNKTHFIHSTVMKWYKTRVRISIQSVNIRTSSTWHLPIPAGPMNWNLSILKTHRFWTTEYYKPHVMKYWNCSTSTIPLSSVTYVQWVCMVYTNILSTFEHLKLQWDVCFTQTRL